MVAAGLCRPEELMKLHAAVLILAGCAGGTAPPALSPAEPAKAIAEGPKDMSGGLLCRTSCELTKPDQPPPSDKPPPLWTAVAVTTGPVAGFAAYAVELVDNPAHCGGKQLVTKLDKRQPIAKSELPLADVFSLEYPLGLDFTPDTEIGRTSRQAFDDWVDRYHAAFMTARSHFQGNYTSAEAGVQVVAAARIHQLSHRLATVLTYAEIPKGLAAELRDSFCAIVSRQAARFVQDADAAKAVCTEKASLVDTRKPLWWQPICSW